MRKTVSASEKGGEVMTLERNKAEVKIKGFPMPKPTLPQAASQEEREREREGGGERRKNGERERGKERGRERKRMRIEPKQEKGSGQEEQTLAMSRQSSGRQEIIFLPPGPLIFADSAIFWEAERFPNLT